jgi:hypothetical protein
LTVANFPTFAARSVESGTETEILEVVLNKSFTRDDKAVMPLRLGLMTSFDTGESKSI